MSTRRRSAIVARPAKYVALFAYMVFLAFPLLWMLSEAFKSPREIISTRVNLIPEHPTFANFVDAFQQQDLVHAAWNSIQVSVAASVLTIAVALPASYALARYRTVLRQVTLVWVLVSQVFPVILVVIPLFLILKNLGLSNSLFGLILTYVVWTLPFALWMLQGYVRALPRDVEEAAQVDGASRLRTLISVILPLLTPGIVVTVLFAFISAWNEFFFALVLLQSPNLSTLPLTLARFVGAQGEVALGPLAAGAMLATLPGLIVFGFLQRKLTSGLLAGAIKG